MFYILLDTFQRMLIVVWTVKGFSVFHQSAGFMFIFLGIIMPLQAFQAVFKPVRDGECNLHKR